MKIKLLLLLVLFANTLSLSAAKYYLYTGGVNPWVGKVDGTNTNVTDLTSTLNGYAASDVVWMAAGNYATSGAIGLKASMSVYGGFIGTESTISDREISDTDGNGVVEPWEFTNASVILGVGKASTAVGYALFNSSTNYTLDGVSITDHNTTFSTGGAIYATGRPTIQKCIVSDIKSSGNGAGIYANSTGGPYILSCLIQNCDASSNANSMGGGIFSQCKISIQQCIIRNNIAVFGGGICLNTGSDASSTTYIINNAIYNNSAKDGASAGQGGAIIIRGSAADPIKIINNTIVNNYAKQSTGGIIGASTSYQLINNVIYNNSQNGTVLNIRVGIPSFEIINTAYNSGIITAAPIVNTNSNPNLLSPQFVSPSTTIGYTAVLPNDVKQANFAILSNSELYNSATTSQADVPTTDLLGNSKTWGGVPDIGAYEMVSVTAAPTITAVTSGDTQLSVAFTPPSDLSGGAAITNYKYSTDGGLNFTACSPAQTTSPIVITSLTNGVAYNVQIKAVNAVGDGLACSNSVGTPSAASSVPSAPSISRISSTNAQLSVDFNLGQNGGSAITSYKYSTDGGATFRTRAAGTTATPLLISTLSTDGTTGLVNGTSYNIQIKAVNANGDGVASSSFTAIPGIVPGAPTAVVATAGGNNTVGQSGTAEVSVSFTAPVDNGGSTITRYVVNVSPGSNSYWGVSSPIVCSGGLSANTAYTFTVKATNSFGTGAASTASGSVTTATLDATNVVPNPPTLGTLTPSNGQVSIAFTAPTFPSSPAITNYKYSTDGGANFTACSPAQTTSPIVITGLSNGTSYPITIKAVNSIGDGLASSTSDITIASVPSAPTIGVISPSNAQLSVSFAGPTYSGGANATSYKYSTDDGVTYRTRAAGTTASPLDITTLSSDGTTPLVNGTTYSIKIKAVNVNGDGYASATVTAKPSSAPTAPVIGTTIVGDTKATVSFTAPTSDGGTSVSSYTVTSSPGGITASGSSSPIIISGLLNGTAYTFSVTATNVSGTSAASAASNSVTPTTNLTVSASQNISGFPYAATSNITINSGYTLTINQNATVNSVIVDTDAKLDLSDKRLTVVDLILNAGKSTAPSVNVTHAMTVTGTVKVHKTLDKAVWYFISFPSNVAVNSIAQVSGTGTLGAIGTNWWIKYYDGSTRATNGGATSNWRNMIAGDVLAANKGYIIGLAEALTGDYVLSFPFVDAATVQSSEVAKTVSVGLYGEGTAAASHVGWNLVGIPYLSKFAGSGVGVNYITLFNGSSYDQYANSSIASLNPFSSFFIQASNAGTSTNLAFTLGSRQLVKSSVANNLSDRVQLNLTTVSGNDHTNLIIDETQCPSYVINQDLGKWMTTGTNKPQMYTILDGVNYAFNALPLDNIQNLPLGIYTNTASLSTISADVTQAPGISQLLLTDNSNGNITDLLTSNYSFLSTPGTNNTRFSISAQNVSTTTSISQVSTFEPKLSITHGKLLVNNISEKASVRLYDALGRMLENKVTTKNSLEIQLEGKGVYVVVFQAGDKNWIKKFIYD